MECNNLHSTAEGGARRPLSTVTRHLNSTAAFLTVCQIPQRSGIVTGSQASTTSAHWLALDWGAASAFGTADLLGNREGLGWVATISKGRKLYATAPKRATQPVREPSPTRLESCNSADPLASRRDCKRSRSPAKLPAHTSSHCRPAHWEHRARSDTHGCS